MDISWQLIRFLAAHVPWVVLLWLRQAAVGILCCKPVLSATRAIHFIESRPTVLRTPRSVYARTYRVGAHDIIGDGPAVLNV